MQGLAPAFDRRTGELSAKMTCMRLRNRVTVAAVAVTLLGLAGCAGSFPVDTEDSLQRIRTEKVLRAGASYHPPQVLRPAGPDADPTGTEVDLVTAYADRLGARVEWTTGSEATLIEALHEGELDIAVAGFEATSPWSADVTLTRPYTTDTGREGRTIDRVLATRAGENALLVDLERWLDSVPDARLR